MSREILVVTDRPPSTDRDEGSVRLDRLLDALERIGWEATLAVSSATLDERLRHEGPRFDAVLLSRPDVASAHLASVRAHAPQALVVYDTVDLHFLREYRGARLLRSRPALERALARKAQELELVRAADRTLVVSDAERRVLEDECPGRRCVSSRTSTRLPARRPRSRSARACSSSAAPRTPRTPTRPPTSPARCGRSPGGPHPAFG